MKKLMAMLLAALLTVSVVPFSAVAATPDYAVSLEAGAERIYEGETVDIFFNINSEEFVITDMAASYDTTYFSHATNTNGTILFPTPEIFDETLADGDNNYKLKTFFTFTAKGVSDTVEVPFEVAAADIVHNFDDADNDFDTNVSNRTGTTVIIVKQYDVVFEKEDGTQISAITVDKGLGSEADTTITVPSVDYTEFVGAGLVADYYEHVWVYNGTEYTDAEVAAFGQAGSADEITEDTTFVLEVREQTFNVTASDTEFDNPADKATYGTDYTGKINPTEYDEKYIYTVKYEIGGVVKEVVCDEDSFAIPGENITGDMTITYEKELGIEIAVYPEYITGHCLITVRGGAAGYTFEGGEMYKSETHDNLRAWIYQPAVGTSEAEILEYAESVIFASDVASPVSPKTYDLNESGLVNLNDPALAYGAYMAALNPVESWLKTYLTADVNADYVVDTEDYDLVVEAYFAARG